MAALLTLSILTETVIVLFEASETLCAISCVAERCSLTDEVILVEILLISPMVIPIWRMASTTLSVAACMPPTCSEISSVALAV